MFLGFERFGVFEGFKKFIGFEVFDGVPHPLKRCGWFESLFMFFGNIVSNSFSV